METATIKPTPAQLRQSLKQNGFVLVPKVITGTALETYRRAAQSATNLAREGKWPYIRTVPKQFPPWTVADRHKGIWGVQHLLHPDMPAALHKAFAESYFHPELISIITDVLQCSESELSMELYNMLVRPETDFALRWHRDDIRPDVTTEEELRRLQEPMLHAQWNLALFDDESLVVVPGSHARARTTFEREADPLENAMPGQMVVRMGPGDVVFYNNNILHRGVYDCRAERMTLHGTIGLTGADPARARNILQHGIGTWVARADFADLDNGMAGLAQDMQKRLIEMGSGKDVGFSQED